MLPDFLVKRLILALLLLVVARCLAIADSANIFVYHRFDEPLFSSTNTSSADFQSHLEILKKLDFSVISLREMVEKLKSKSTLPQRCAVITVDDAYRSFMATGWPLLKQYGFPATLFVSTDYVGQEGYLDWDELAALSKEGVEIGNHSASHEYLINLLEEPGGKERVLVGLQRSQDAFEEHLGIKPVVFAYPFGEFSPELTAEIKGFGFLAAFGQQSGVATPDQDFFKLPRFPMGGADITAESFRSKLLMKHLPLTVIEPTSTIVNDNNPPKLLFLLGDGRFDKSTLNCYVPGQLNCQLKQLDGEEGLFEVMAEEPIAGRRSKYTITASDRSGETWYWFSHLWVLPGW